MLLYTVQLYATVVDSTATDRVSGFKQQTTGFYCCVFVWHTALNYTVWYRASINYWGPLQFGNCWQAIDKNIA